MLAHIYTEGQQSHLAGRTDPKLHFHCITSYPQRLLVSDNCSLFCFQVSFPWKLFPLLEQEHWTKWLREDPTNISHTVILWFYDKIFLTFKNHQKWKKRNNGKITVIPKLQQHSYEWGINILFTLREEKSRIHILSLTHST